MYAILLQDWVTIRSSTGNAITQSEGDWLDMSPFLDLTVFMETKNFATSTGNLYMAFQTSPTKDEALFQAMNDTTATTGVAVALGVQTFVMLRDTALCPLARWLRWQLAPAGATSFESTFRIWVAANQPGGFATDVYRDAYGNQVMGGVDGGPAWTQAPGGSAPSSYTEPPTMKPHGGTLQTSHSPTWRVKGSSSLNPYLKGSVSREVQDRVIRPSYQHQTGPAFNRVPERKGSPINPLVSLEKKVT